MTSTSQYPENLTSRFSWSSSSTYSSSSSSTSSDSTTNTNTLFSPLNIYIHHPQTLEERETKTRNRNAIVISRDSKNGFEIPETVPITSEWIGSKWEIFQNHIPREEEVHAEENKQATKERNRINRNAIVIPRSSDLKEVRISRDVRTSEEGIPIYEGWEIWTASACNQV